MKVFYFGLSENAQQTVDALFVGGMLKSSMASNSEKWNDDGFGSHQGERGKLKKEWIEMQR